MARNGYELATAYVTVTGETSGLASSIGKAFAGGDRIATAAGRQMGQAMAKAFQQDAPDLEKLADESKRAGEKVARAAEQVARRRADASRQVEIAEAKVIEVRDRSIAQDRKVVAAEKDLAAARKAGDPEKVTLAEERLAKARDAVKPSSADMAAEDRLAKAKQKYIDTSRDGVETLSRFAKQQKQATDALQDAKRAADQADQSVDKAAGAFGRLGDKLKNGFKAAFSSPFKSIEDEADRSARVVEREFDDAGERAGNGFGGKFKYALGGALIGMAGFIGGKISIDGIMSSVQASGDLEQSIGAIDTIFKDSAGQMHAWGQQSSKTFGLARNEFNELSTVLGAQLKNGGLGTDQLAGMTYDLMGLSADLSSMFGGSTADAAAAISSALKGERDPIEAYGVSLKQASIDAKAAELGFSKVNGQLSSEANQAATLALIMDQTADAHGNFSREADTFSHKQQVMTASFEDMKAALGERLMPVMADLFGWITDKGIPAFEDLVGALGGADFTWLSNAAGEFGDWLVNTGVPNVIAFTGELKLLPDWIKDNQVWLSTLTATVTAFGVATWAASGGTAVLSGAVATLFTAIKLGIKSIPVIGWIIAGVGLLVSGLAYFFTQTETGQKLWNNFWTGAKIIAASVWGWISGTLIPGMQNLWGILTTGEGDGADSGIGRALAVIHDVGSEVIGWVTETLIPGVQDAWAALTTGGGDGKESGFTGMLAGIHDAASAAIGWVTGSLIPGLQSAWATVASGLQWLLGVASDVWYGIRFAAAMAVAIIMTILTPFTWFVTSVLAPLFVWLWRDVIAPAWSGIGDAISGVIGWLTGSAWPLIQGVIAWIGGAFSSLGARLAEIWGGIQSRVIQPVVTWFSGTAWPAILAVINLAKSGFNILRDSIGAAWRFIQAVAIQPVLSWFQGTAWPLISTVLGFIGAKFNAVRDTIGAAWSWIRSVAIQPVLSWFDSTLGPTIDRITGGIKSAFETMRDAVGKAWDSIKSAAMTPIRFVIETVINDGIIANFNKIAKSFGVKELEPIKAGFARGGILPGFSRMRDGDDQLVPMRRGEGVLVSEGLRDTASRAAFLAANAAAKRGVPFSRFIGGGFAEGGITGFAGGGILSKIKGIGGDVLDWMQDAGGFVADVLTDPKGAFGKLASGLTGAIPGAGMMLDLAKAIPTKIASVIGDSLFGGLQQSDAASAAAAPAGPTVAGGSLGLAQSLAAQHGLRMTSSRRGGARTAGSGAVSLHALGRAMDFSNSSGPTPQMMAFFNAMHRYKPTELLYSPAGGRQWRRSGRQADTSGVTKRIHYNHVHVGFADGGILAKSFPAIQGFGGGQIVAPTLYDRGGILAPGTQVISNQTRRPEMILPPDQTAFLKAAAEGGSGGGTTLVYAPQQTDLSEQIDHRMRREFEAMRFQAMRQGVLS